MRTGVPTGLGGLHDVVANPSYATGVGLCMPPLGVAPATLELKGGRRKSSGGGRGKWFNALKPLIERYF